MSYTLKKYVTFLFIPALLFARGEVDPNLAPGTGVEAPWFTGPLLASSGTVVPVGHINFEPYLFYFDSSQRYGSDWKTVSNPRLIQVTFQPFFWVGLTKWADLQITPAFNWKHTEAGPSYWTLGDWSAKFEFQLYRASFPHKNWVPNIKFGIQEIFPTGKYQKLNPQKLSSDVGGTGSYTTNLQLSFSRFCLLQNQHWLQLRLNLNYALSAPVDVSGYNAYGVAHGSKGKANPGDVGLFDFAMEYSLTKNWALTCDFVGKFQKRSHFSNLSNVTERGLLPINGAPHSIQFSIAPALEYNWSQQMGVIAGAWMTVAGLNSTKFYSGVIAFNYNR